MSLSPLDYVYTTSGATAYGTSTLTIRITDTKFSYTATITSSSSNYRVQVTTGTATFYINGVSIQTLTFTDAAFTTQNVTKTGTFTNAITTPNVRIAISFRGTAWDMRSQGAPVGLYSLLTYDTTFTVQQPASITSSVLAVNTSTRPWIVLLPSSVTPTILHIKNIGDQTMHVGVSTKTIEDLTSSRQVLANGGLSMFQDGTSNWFLASYYSGGALTTDTTTGGTSATSSVVLANITSGNKLVGLPNPANFGYLMICGYTTGTTTTNRLYIITNGYARETSASAYYFTTVGGPSIGVFLVSDGTKWGIVGIYRGTNTTFDTTVGGYTQATSSIAMSSSITSDSMNVSATDPASNTAVLHIWKTKAIQWLNGAVIGANWNDAVNANYHRFYRNDNPDYSCYMVVNTKVGTGTPTVFPVAQYPSDN